MVKFRIYLEFIYFLKLKIFVESTIDKGKN